MLLHVLNIILLILAGVSGLIAVIGGENIRKNRREFIRRITARGWFSIACVLLTLVTAVWRQAIINKNEDDQKRENAKQVGKIETLGSELDKANQTISDMRTKLVEAQLASKKTSDAIQAYVYERLAGHTTRFLEKISEMIEEASDGWLPKDEKEFFSRRSVDLICRELNADGPARVSPPQSWFTWFSRAIHEYRTTLSEILRSHASHLDTTLITAISNVETAITFSFIPQAAAIRRTNQDFRRLPPLLCHGDGVEDQAESDFAALAILYSEVKRGVKRFNAPRVVRLRLPAQSTVLGRNRFTPEQLSKWWKDHGFNR